MPASPVCAYPRSSAANALPPLFPPCSSAASLAPSLPPGTLPIVASKSPQSAGFAGLLPQIGGPVGYFSIRIYSEINTIKGMKPEAKSPPFTLLPTRTSLPTTPPTGRRAHLQSELRRPLPSPRRYPQNAPRQELSAPPAAGLYCTSITTCTTSKAVV